MLVYVRSVIVIAAALMFGACGRDASREPGSTPAPPSSTAAPAAPAGADAEFGAPECDDYVKRYLACIDRMPAAAQTPARQALEQTRASWKQAGVTEQGRAALAMTCKAAIDTAAPAMRAQGCSW